jgi:hypothetical protein
MPRLDNAMPNEQSFMVSVTWKCIRNKLGSFINQISFSMFLGKIDNLHRVR